MSSYIFGAAAAAATAWGYLSYVQPITGAKYYVSQQLAQMQAHRFNKFNILKACRGDPRLTQLVTQIFEDYERDIEFTEWKWVKLRTGKWACIPAARAQRLRANQRVSNTSRGRTFSPERATPRSHCRTRAAPRPVERSPP